MANYLKLFSAGSF